MALLDDLPYTRRIDRHNMLDGLIRYPDLCSEAVALGKEAVIPSEYRGISTIVIAGVGGSAIGGSMVKNLLSPTCRVPIEVCRDYDLPAYAGERTLVFSISYSGNTEETLCSFVDAMDRRCKVLGITSGGALKEFCDALRVPLIRVPSGLVPRAALPYLFLSNLVVLGRLGFADVSDGEIDETIENLRDLRSSISPHVPTERNPAKKLASSIHGTIPMIYAASIFRPAAVRIKNQFNENAKMLAKSEFFPELDHNEVVGWEGARDLARSLSVIVIRDVDEDEGTRERIGSTVKQISKYSGVRTFEIWARGRSRLAKLLSVVYTGDLVSYYLAILSGVDPTVTESIDVIKRSLKGLGTKEKVRRKVERIRLAKR